MTVQYRTTSISRVRNACSDTQIVRLYELADEFLAEHYGMRMTIDIIRNNRLRRAMGKFVSRKGVPLHIEMSGQVLEYGHPDAIDDVFKHELIHFALCAQGRPFNDGHPEFEAELRKHGVTSTRTNMVGKVTVVACGKCGVVGNELLSIKQLNSRYVTTCCRAKFVHVADDIYDGTGNVERRDV